MNNSVRRWLKFGTGIGISVACIAFVFSRIDMHELGMALGNFSWPFMLVALLSLSVGYLFRIIRWSTMLRAGGARTTAAACAPAFLGSMALNNVLPLRAGDIVRAFVFPSMLGIRRTTATASIVLERVIDLLTLLACLGIGTLFGTVVRIAESQKVLIVLLSVGSAGALLAILIFSAPIGRLLASWSASFGARQRIKASTLLKQFAELFLRLASMSRPATLARLGFLSILVWIGEAGLFLAILQGFGITASPASALTAMAVATLATLVPSSPGYVGPFHLAAYSTVMLMGSSEPQAAGFALLAHLALWIPITLAGLIGILINPQLFQRSTRPLE